MSSAWFVALTVLWPCCHEVAGSNSSLDGSSGELRFAEELRAGDGEHILTIGQVPFVSYSFPTRGFNGGIPGPTFRAKAGETLEIQLVNNLSSSNNLVCSQASSNFCEAGTTNLHVHGLHVSSKGKEDGWSYYSDDILAELQPGETERFKFALPEYHMPGIHWYHPHHHHSVALQAGAGAAGVIVVEDPPGYLPAVYERMPERIMLITGHKLRTLEVMATAAQSGLFENAVVSAEAEGLPTNIFLVNGQFMPTMTMASHIWHRFRIVFSSVEQGMILQMTQSTGGGKCYLQLLAKDGIYLHSFPRDIEAIHLYAGSRADVAVLCTCESFPCNATLGTKGTKRRMQGNEGDSDEPLFNMQAPPVPEVALMQLLINETEGGVVEELPLTVVDRPCYLVDLQGVDVPESDRHEISFQGRLYRIQWDGSGDRMSYDAVSENSGRKRTWPAIGTLQSGKVYEIAIIGTHLHPVHFHINPFQIVDLPGGPFGDGYYQEGDWHDALMLIDIPQNTAVNVRMQTDKFTGKMVSHCHVLHHEDEGMMAFIDIVGCEDEAWLGAREIDAQCQGPSEASDRSDCTASSSSTTTMDPSIDGAVGSLPSCFLLFPLLFLWVHELL